MSDQNQETAEEQQAQAQKIEISMEEAQRQVKMMNALLKLENNEYFKEVILEGYLIDYAVDLVKRKAMFNLQEPKSQKYIDDQITAIGQLNQYLGFILREGNLAEKAIQADREELDRIDAENSKEA